ncbi:MAG TPA: leucine-rich repeat protein [Galbitalea sp.]|nr:leucine-rich repeat protein [Galbitalea sp.]
MSILAIAGITAWLIFGMAAPASAAPITETVGDFTFTADDSNVAAGAAVAGFGYTGPSDVVIPSSVVLSGVTYAVTSLAPFAFDSAGLTTAIVPDSVTDIGEEAFSFDTSLTSVSLGNSVTSIGLFAFVNDGLTAVTFPDSLTTIHYGSFYGNALTSVTIPATVTTLEGNAFGGNPLTSVILEGAVPGGLQSGSSGQGSFGSGAGVTMNYQWRFGEPQTAGGYTSPTWLDYTTHVMTTVSFDLAGHGSAIAPQVLNSGGLAVEPLAPIASAWAFTGWFTDSTLTTKANFSDPVTTDETLTAGWVTTLAPTGTSSGLAAPAALTALAAGPLLVLLGYRRRGRAVRAVG